MPVRENNMKRRIKRGNVKMKGNLKGKNICTRGEIKGELGARKVNTWRITGDDRFRSEREMGRYIDINPSAGMGAKGP